MTQTEKLSPRTSTSSTSSTGNTIVVPHSGAGFTPSSTLHIHAHGLRVIRIPFPSSEVTIPVYNDKGEVVYASLRAKKCKGDAVLVGISSQGANANSSSTLNINDLADWEEGSPENLSATPLVDTKYFFGPSRDPVVQVFSQDNNQQQQQQQQQIDLLTDSKNNVDDEKKHPTPSLRSAATDATLTQPPADTFTFNTAWTTRTCTFTDPRTNHTFSWDHERTVLASGEKAKLLSLYWHVPASRAAEFFPAESNRAEAKKGKGGLRIKVAQLVRSESTRTPGTRASYAGNGGNLELGSMVKSEREGGPKTACDVIYGVEVKGKQVEGVIEEPLVVATCIAMMKKEMDRRRMMQFAMISGMVSGGV